MEGVQEEEVEEERGRNGGGWRKAGTAKEYEFLKQLGFSPSYLRWVLSITNKTLITKETLDA